MRQMSLAVGVAALLASQSLAQSSRDVAVHDSDGQRVVRSIGPQLDRFLPPPHRSGVLWTLHDPVSIVESVAVADTANESWLAHNLNDKRVSKLTTDGPGTPDFVYSMAAENPSSIGVGSAETVSLGVAVSHPSGGPVTVRAFTHAGGNVPIWTYTFPAGHVSAGKRSVDASADGSVVAVVAYDGANSTLVILDGATGAVLNTAAKTGFSSALELSDDGTRVLLTRGASAELLDVATMASLRTVTVSGAGGFHRLSRDGGTIAAGGFNIRVEREVGGVWTIAYTGTGSSEWFGWAMAVSGDGRYVFAGSHNYAQGYLPNNYRIVDLDSGQVIATGGYIGSGSKQNSMVGAHANADGTVFAVASWGDEFKTEPQVRVFDRDLNEIGSIETVGSPFALDMTLDGRYLLVGCKSIHANDSGNGGTTYLYEISSPCYADCNGDTVIDTQDFLCFLNLFVAGDPAADCNGDTVIDTQDFLCFLNAFVAGCP